MALQAYHKKEVRGGWYGSFLGLSKANPIQLPTRTQHKIKGLGKDF